MIGTMGTRSRGMGTWMSCFEVAQADAPLGTPDSDGFTSTTFSSTRAAWAKVARAESTAEAGTTVFRTNLVAGTSDSTPGTGPASRVGVRVSRT